ncbi:MAG: hypothetical protein WDM87_11835 [Terracidiphilus sp.]
MIPSEFIMLLEATLRALIAAFAVWAGMRVLRVKNVPAQKAAWGLMLVAALAMPLLMRWQLVPAWAAVNLPVPSLKKMAAPVPADMQVLQPGAIAPVLSSRGPETIAQPSIEEREDFPALAVRFAQAIGLVQTIAFIPRQSQELKPRRVRRLLFKSLLPGPQLGPQPNPRQYPRPGARRSSQPRSKSRSNRGSKLGASSRSHGFSTSAFVLRCSSGFSGD